MKVSYTVHRTNKTTISKVVSTLVNGAPVDVMAHIPGYEVELTGADGHSGTVTLRFIGDEVAEAEAAYVEGDTVTADYPGRPMPAPETEDDAGETSDTDTTS